MTCSENKRHLGLYLYVLRNYKKVEAHCGCVGEVDIGSVMT